MTEYTLFINSSPLPLYLKNMSNDFQAWKIYGYLIVVYCNDMSWPKHVQTLHVIGTWCVCEDMTGAVLHFLDLSCT